MKQQKFIMVFFVLFLLLSQVNAQKNEIPEVKKSIKREKLERMPQFKGGTEALYKFITENLEYPSKAKEDGVEGRVVIRFIISKSGKVSDIEVVKSLSKECDAEAIRLVESMPDWIPGMIEGEPVDVQYTLPVRFKINQGGARDRKPIKVKDQNGVTRGYQ